jgi:hypothetical protein
MEILYISILLAVLGFIFIITSVEKKKASEVRTQPYPKERLSTPVVYTEEDSPAEKTYEQVRMSVPSTPMAVTTLHNEEAGIYEVILYSDESGVSLDKGTVDASNLKNLSREGRGVAEITRDAVTVRIEKKLFRFDYYRLDRVAGQNECVVLSLKGSKGASIMISENPLFFNRVNSEYLQFHG